MEKRDFLAATKAAGAIAAFFAIPTAVSWYGSLSPENYALVWKILWIALFALGAGAVVFVFLILFQMFRGS